MDGLRIPISQVGDDALNHRIRKLLLSCVALVLIMAASLAHANVLQWTGNAGTALWSDSVNWFDLHAPPFPMLGHDQFPLGIFPCNISTKAPISIAG